MRTLEELREIFSNDLYATETTGIEILEAGGGHAKVALTTTPKHKNARGEVMGAVYFTMADFAFAVAMNTDERQLGITLESNIKFLTTPKTDRLFAETRLVKAGRTVSFYEVDVTDELGRLVATVSTTGFNVMHD